MRAVIAVLLMFGAGADAWAASDPCAKYTDADAYNYCLAGSGPVARPRTFSRPPDAARPPALENRSRAQSGTAAKPAARRLPRGLAPKPAPRGRVHFQIIPR